MIWQVFRATKSCLYFFSILFFFCWQIVSSQFWDTPKLLLLSTKNTRKKRKNQPNEFPSKIVLFLMLNFVSSYFEVVLYCIRCALYPVVKFNIVENFRLFSYLEHVHFISFRTGIGNRYSKIFSRIYTFSYSFVKNFCVCENIPCSILF